MSLDKPPKTNQTNGNERLEEKILMIFSHIIKNGYQIHLAALIFIRERDKCAISRSRRAASLEYGSGSHQETVWGGVRSRNKLQRETLITPLTGKCLYITQRNDYLQFHKNYPVQTNGKI